MASPNVGHFPMVGDHGNRPLSFSMVAPTAPSVEPIAAAVTGSITQVEVVLINVIRGQSRQEAYGAMSVAVPPQG